MLNSLCESFVVTAYFGHAHSLPLGKISYVAGRLRLCASKKLVRVEARERATLYLMFLCWRKPRSCGQTVYCELSNSNGALRILLHAHSSCAFRRKKAHPDDLPSNVVDVQLFDAPAISV
jgi:hypothetical protein